MSGEIAVSPRHGNASPGLIRRAQRIADARIEYIDHPSFGDRSQWSSIMAPCTSSDGDDEATSSDTAHRAGGDAYFAGLVRARVLDPAEEARLFRQMNFLKFRAEQLRYRLNPQRPNRSHIGRIERLSARAYRIRARLIQSNLRLVVAIARKYATPTHTIDELISEGNCALIRAVEKFDVSRGFRFSTYATHAVRRQLWRCIGQIRDHRERESTLPHVSVDMVFEGLADDRGSVADPLKQALRIRKFVNELLGQLNDRERYILRARFGLLPGEAPMTLQAIANQLDISKERVRQLATRNLAKLRQLAGGKMPVEFGDAPPPPPEESSGYRRPRPR